MKRRDFLSSSLLAAAATLPGIRAARAVPTSGAVADILAVTGDGQEITLRGADVQSLAGELRGALLVAGEDGYDRSRLVLNPSFDKHPALIACPASVADVQAVVRFARAHALLVAVKCGGHSASGQSTCDRGLQVDLSGLRGVRVDAARKRAWVEGGTLLGQVDAECMAHGLVTPLGTVSHTGVGGLTTGGGFGRLARRFGMAIDNLESVDVVTGNGALLHASATENPDLFWGVRGGGGNFGIVTRFEFRLHPMQRQVVAGEVSFPIARAKDALDMFAEYAASAPDELYLDPALVHPPGGRPGYALLEVCYSGPAGDAERALAPLRKLGNPANDTIKTVDYVDAQRANDTGDNRTLGTYLKGGFIPRLPGALVDAIVGGLEADPERISILFFQHCGGAAGRVPEKATAFAQRDAIANMMAVSGWTLGASDPAKHMAATRKYWSTLEPFTRGFYVNDLAREVTSKDINENFRGNHARLVAVKKKHDPTNLFRLNANVKPG
jgi:FAD/FMN-containing dehydrogenase